MSDRPRVLWSFAITAVAIFMVALDNLAADELGNTSRVTWALETHVHNDFVSGARELRAEVGAAVGAGRDSQLSHPYEPLSNGQELEVGPFRLRVLATPGHTPEHVSYLLLDETGRSLALFSGGR